MANDIPPPILVSLASSPNVRPAPGEDAGEEQPGPVKVGQAIPGMCRFVLYSPASKECPSGCAGQQKDGGCLCDIVRAAREQGVHWSFEVRYDQYGNQYWKYDGPPLAERDTHG